MAERIESLCRTTVNGKQSAELVNVIFTHTHTHTHSMAKTQNASLTTYRDKSHSIKINSVTAKITAGGGEMLCYKHRR